MGERTDDFTLGELMTLMLGIVAYRETRTISLPTVPQGIPQPLTSAAGIDALKEELVTAISKRMNAAGVTPASAGIAKGVTAE